MKIYGVMGKPIINSLSPDMHNAAFMHLGIDAAYVRLASKNAQEGISSSYEIEIEGINVTSPYKEDILDVIDKCSRESYEIGAVNTILLKSGSDMLGYNTDIYGVHQALVQNASDPKDKTVLIIGAGGAAKAAAYSMIKNGAKVIVANRTLQKAEKISKDLGCESVDLSSTDLKEKAKKSDIIISCINSVEQVLPSEVITNEKVILDAYYANESRLVSDAKQNGAKIIDGREWLLYQGAKAFEIFTGKIAPVEVMRKALMERLPKAKKSAVALLGPMGSGKTTIGKILSEKRHVKTLSLDQMIENENNISIAQIFEKYGEEKFRDLESEMLKKALQNEGTVLDCGGGIVLRENNKQLLEQKTLRVLLLLSRREIRKRLKDDTTRPLLNSKTEESEDKVEKMIKDRIRKYVESSDIVVCSGNKKPQTIADVISNEIDNAR